ncbi:hypothetical protein ABZ894_23830 [Nocardia beijingensis]|uniref:hypothetical protein n=1 Tax=Nocardia beijingensis TaxID=95162 RepID=UPI0033FE27D7
MRVNIRSTVCFYQAVVVSRGGQFRSDTADVLADERGYQQIQQGDLVSGAGVFDDRVEHRGGVGAGDRAEGIRAARSAMDALPPEKHSLTLRMLMDEIAGSGGGAT